MVAISIQCGRGAIKVYEQSSGDGCEPQVQYRAATARLGKRLWGRWATCIQSTVASLLPKLKLNQAQRDALWAEFALKEIDAVHLIHPAVSHKPPINSGKGRPFCATQPLPSAVVFFQTNPFEGKVRPRKRSLDGKVRMELCRKGHRRVSSNWHSTSEEAVECIRE